MIRITITLLFLFLISCRSGNNNKDVESYFEKEIKNRILVLEKDTLLVDASEIDREINRIILLSKDVENLSASVNLGNKYFQDLSSKLSLNNSDLTALHPLMHVDEISLALRQNELNVLNQLIFRSGRSSLPLHTAN